MHQAPRGLTPRCGFPSHVASLAVCVAGGLLLAVAWHLEPNPAGFGTHRQLGLPACGFIRTAAFPCATCGMTTAFAFAARGDLVAALIAQPVGALLALAVAAAVLVSGYALVVGVSLAPLALALWRPRPLLIMAGLVLVAWVYKIVMFHAST